MRFSTATIISLAIVVVLGLLLAGGVDVGNRLAAQEKTAGEGSTESGEPDDKSANKAKHDFYIAQRAYLRYDRPEEYEKIDDFWGELAQALVEDTNYWMRLSVVNLDESENS